jgi:hypothetical protein
MQTHWLDIKRCELVHIPIHFNLCAPLQPLLHSSGLLWLIQVISDVKVALTFSSFFVRSRRRGPRGRGWKVGASTLQRHLHRP